MALQLSLKRAASPLYFAALSLQTQRRCFSVHSPRQAKDKSRAKNPESGYRVSSSDLVPASQRMASGDEYFKLESKMQAVMEYFRKEVALLDMRASGRVTPAILAPVRVPLPDQKDAKGVRLEEVATVGVKEGTTLLVTVFEEHMLKPVTDALYESKIPGVVPQKVDDRTVRIPLPKPTVEARLELFAVAKRQAEDMRVQIRRHHDASVRKGKYGKRDPEFDEFKGLQDKYMKELDKVLGDLKKSTGAK